MIAALLAAPLALAVRAQNAPAQPAAAPQPPTGQQPGAQQDQQPPPSTEPLPTFRADINFVRVDVIVSDKQGNPVNDLRAEDFEVTEDGKPQKVQTFKLINVTENAGVGSDPPRQIRSVIDEQTEAARDDVRLFAVFLDDYHVRLDNSMRTREVLAQFVENQLGPADMAGIMYPLWSINDVLLSRDRRSMAAAIRSFTGRKYNYEPKNLFEERYVHYVSTIEAERIRNQVVFSALKGLIIRMGGLREGRKAIILVSEGFTNTLPSQVQYQIASRPENDLPKVADPVVRDPALQSRIDSQEFFQQSELMADLRSVYELANRYNTAIYALDPRGLAASEFDLTTQGSAQVSLKRDAQFLGDSINTLRTLADETDGRAIVNSNDLDRGLRQIVRDTSAYYLLGYTSTLSEPDGRFHKINVRIKRPGVQVRARPGYLAMSAIEVERAVTSTKKTGPPPAITEAFATLASTSQRRSLIGTWIGMSPGTNGKTKISFVWNPAAARPGVRAETPATLSLIAGGANSDLFYRGRSLAPGRVEFEVPPGQIDLEIAVEDAGKEVIDRETRQIVVPSLGLGLTFSTPQLFRARTLPELRAVATNPDAVPSIEREFRRTDRVLLRVAAQSAAGTPAVTARMLNREGGEMSSLPVTPAGFDGFSHIDLNLASIPLGEYLVEVTAKDAGEIATTLVAFRVIP